MRFGSLFAGVGGMDLGLERAGMECAWQVEKDDYCTEVLEKYWPDIIKYKDVRDVGRRNLEPVDLIAGGFPCQPHSVAGKRKGAADDRNLWPEFSRIIAELKPRYILAENVPGIITTYLDTVLSDLESQAYTCATFNIPACAFNAPHRRERIFIVAYTRKFGGGGRDNEDAQRQGGTLQTEGSGSRDQQGFLAYSKSKSSNVSNNNSRISMEGEQIPKSRDGGRAQDVADADKERQPNFQRGGKETKLARGRTPSNGSWWNTEPRLGDLVDGLPPELAGRFIRVAEGCSNRVNKLCTLGNAVVPQVAEWIGQRIIEFDERR